MEVEPGQSDGSGSETLLVQIRFIYFLGGSWGCQPAMLPVPPEPAVCLRVPREVRVARSYRPAGGHTNSTSTRPCTAYKTGGTARHHNHHHRFLPGKKIEMTLRNRHYYVFLSLSIFDRLWLLFVLFRLIFKL